MGRYEILEHTADVGIAAWGATLEETFQQATLGLADICGTWIPGEGAEIAVTVTATDIEASLVDWLNEVLWLQDSRDSILTAVEVAHVNEEGATGVLTIAPRDTDLEGTAVKAATYHQLKVEPVEEGWFARVFVDV
jgi:SHS2 domain-containing protein